MKLAAAGHTAALLTLTRGDAGLWLGKDFGMWSKADLGAERAKEWAAAVATIGRTVYLLGGISREPLATIIAVRPR
jgi:LmbE family N-acetylglucosaminyl deacetylase